MSRRIPGARWAGLDWTSFVVWIYSVGMIQRQRINNRTGIYEIWWKMIHDVRIFVSRWWTAGLMGEWWKYKYWLQCCHAGVVMSTSRYLSEKRNRGNHRSSVYYPQSSSRDLLDSYLESFSVRTAHWAFVILNIFTNTSRQTFPTSEQKWHFPTKKLPSTPAPAKSRCFQTELDVWSGL